MIFYKLKGRKIIMSNSTSANIPNDILNPSIEGESNLLWRKYEISDWNKVGGLYLNPIIKHRD